LCKPETYKAIFLGFTVTIKGKQSNDYQVILRL